MVRERLAAKFLIAIALIGIPVGAWAQAGENGQGIERTVDGRPDLQGVWVASFLTTVERPPGIDALVVSAQDAAALVSAIQGQIPELNDPDVAFHGVARLARVEGERRTSLVTHPNDGQIPFTDAALEQVQAFDAAFGSAFDGPEQRPTMERCLAGLGQAPMRTMPVPLPRQIVQTEDHVVIMSEDVAGLRIVELDGEAPPDIVRSLEGYSRGWWEDDTLVIETTHLRRDDPIRFAIGRSIVVGPDSRIIERLTRVAEDELRYQFTVEDEALYSGPWMAEYSMTAMDQPIYEYACHEANVSMKGILLGGRWSSP